MKPGCGGSCREAIFSIQSLVVRVVAKDFFDIWRSRHGTDLREGYAEERFFLVEMERAFHTVAMSNGSTKFCLMGGEKDMVTDFEAWFSNTQIAGVA